VLTKLRLNSLIMLLLLPMIDQNGAAI